MCVSCDAMSTMESYMVRIEFILSYIILIFSNVPNDDLDTQQPRRH